MHKHPRLSVSETVCLYSDLGQPPAASPAECPFMTAELSQDAPPIKMATGRASLGCVLICQQLHVTENM